MPSSSVNAFTDPDEFAASVRYASVNLHVSARGVFAAKLVRIDFNNLWLQRFSDSLPRVGVNSLPGSRAVVDFGTSCPSTVVRGGIELTPEVMSLPRADEVYHERTSGPTSTAAMSLPTEEMVAYGATILGRDLHPPSDRRVFVPRTAPMERLRRLHAATGALAEDAPAVIANPETAHALEQALIDAMMGCLAVETDEDRAAQRRHARVMRRFERAIDASPDRPLYLPELCRKIGVSERTLRACCDEHLGMAPKRYLLLRRMHMVRRALRESSAGSTTVTEIATQYGFWQFGRLAAEYKALFGEVPSTTLARSA